MAVEINNNPGGGGNDGGGSAMTAIVAILVIVIIGLAIWFGFRGRGASTDGGANINVSLPAGSGDAGGPAY
ncbi:hypothetical protein KW796_01270 [Candidatus Parcubacteria bacterium]|nr:hypothetical protein [Candidatus Parcubacteria bacterium]